MHENTIFKEKSTDSSAVNAQHLFDTFSIQTKQLCMDELNVIGLHYTSNDDNNFSINRVGLRNLQYSLSHNTSLYRFLKDNGILFDIEDRKMVIDGKIHDITFTHYNYAEPITCVAHKVYADYHLCCFLYIKDVSQYGGEVDQKPEILLNIDRLCPEKRLQQKWINQCKQYCLKFFMPINSFAPYSFCGEVSYEYPDSKHIKLVESLVDKALIVACSTSSQMIGHLLPNETVPKSNIISIQEFTIERKPAHE
jgi:hypothetical protein